LVFGVSLLFLLATNSVCPACNVRIWDNDAPGWTTTFADCDPIDTGTANEADNTQLAIDSNGFVYVTYQQSDGALDHIYLSRYDAPTGATGGGGGGSSGCFIATATYGSLIEPHVKILRDFRDRFLLNNSVGKEFVRLYYTYSPPVADYIKTHDSLKAVVRVGLLPVVGISWIALKVGPAFTMGLILLALFFFTGLVWIKRRYNE
jgi:hypothetical protein